MSTVAVDSRSPNEAESVLVLQAEISRLREELRLARQRELELQARMVHAEVEIGIFSWYDIQQVLVSADNAISELHQIKSSTMWRLTLPARLFLRVIKAIRRRVFVKDSGR